MFCCAAKKPPALSDQESTDWLSIHSRGGANGRRLSVGLFRLTQQPNEGDGIMDVVRYPMWVMPISALLELDLTQKLPPHQALREQGLLRVFTPDTDAGRVLFVSHQWCGVNHPDPSGAQFARLQRALAKLKTGSMAVKSHPQLIIGGGAKSTSGSEWKAVLSDPTTYVWYDFFSVPQPSHSADASTIKDMKHAVFSIPFYITHSWRVLVLAPTTKHHDDDAQVCDYWSWMGRGWCRLEAIVHALGPHGGEPSLLVQGESDVCYRSHYDCLHRPVGDGQFSVPADKRTLVPVLVRTLKQRLQRLLDEGNLFMYRWTRAMRPYFLRGLPLGEPDVARRFLHAEEATWESFKDAYKFESALQDDRGYTPLTYAVMSNNVAVARELLAQHGADVHGRTRIVERSDIGNLGGDSLLATCMQSNGGVFDPAEMIALLLEHGADPLALSPHSGNSLLNEAAMWGNAETLRVMIELEPRLLTQQHYPAELHPPFYHTPALACAIWGQLEPVLVLREAGADFSGLEFIGHSVLHAAAHWGYADVLREFLHEPSALAHLDEVATPPVNVHGRLNAFGNFLYYVHRGLHAAGQRDKMITFMADSVGGTPLHGAVSGDNILCASLLLSAKADPAVRNIHGETALELAERMGLSDMAEVLRSEGRRRSLPTDDKRGGTDVEHRLSLPGGVVDLDFVARRAAERAATKRETRASTRRASSGRTSSVVARSAGRTSTPRNTRTANMHT